MIRIALIGDYDERVTAHRAIPVALRLAAADLGVGVDLVWMHTSSLGMDRPGGLSYLGFDGVWCVPASPYANEAGALNAIRYARESGTPFLGTCGGFQHAVLEFARNVLHIDGAQHAETAVSADALVITKLSCSLVEVTGRVRFAEGSRLSAAYGTPEAIEGYHCNYGLNPDFESALTGAGIRMTARDEGGDVRGIELDGHPFFVATLFQPERIALEGRTPPIVKAFLCTSAEQQGSLGSAAPLA